MLRDRLVVGIRDAALSDKLQTEAALTLEKAKMLIRQKEAAKEHRRELQDNTEEATVGKVGAHRHFQNRSSSGGGKSQSHKGVTQQNKCGRCWRDKHQPGERCPAIGATCHFCYKKGHFNARVLQEDSIKNHSRSPGDWPRNH